MARKVRTPVPKVLPGQLGFPLVTEEGVRVKVQVTGQGCCALVYVNGTNVPLTAKLETSYNSLDPASESGH